VRKSRIDSTIGEQSYRIKPNPFNTCSDLARIRPTGSMTLSLLTRRFCWSVTARIENGSPPRLAGLVADDGQWLELGQPRHKRSHPRGGAYGSVRSDGVFRIFFAAPTPLSVVPNPDLLRRWRQQSPARAERNADASDRCLRFAISPAAPV
jgi:hypothetical protein